MGLSTTQTTIMSGLIAVVLASAGGYQFLKKTPNPTLRQVFAACQKDEIQGLACCEDMLRVDDNAKLEEKCGMVTSKTPDPFGVRAKEEDDWDAELANEEKGLK